MSVFPTMHAAARRHVVLDRVQQRLDAVRERGVVADVPRAALVRDLDRLREVDRVLHRADVTPRGVGREQQRDRDDHRHARAEPDPRRISSAGRSDVTSSASAAGTSTTTVPLTHARCAESARCTRLREHAEPEQRAREQHAAAATRRDRGARARSPNATSATASTASEHEPDEQLLRGREPGERPRPIDGGDDAGDADEMIRVGRHRASGARRAGGSSGRRSCRATRRAGPGRGEVHDVGREADRRCRSTARLTTGRGKAPQRGRAAEREREPEVDAEQHREPGEHAAGQRPARAAAGRRRLRERSCRACSSATSAPSASAAPPVQGIAISCNDGITNMTLSSTAATATHAAPPPHEQARAERHADELHQPGEPFDERGACRRPCRPRRAPTGCPGRRGTRSPCSGSRRAARGRGRRA